MSSIKDKTMKRCIAILIGLFLASSLMANLNDDLFEAVKKGDKKKVAALIKKGADVNARDANYFRPLHHAAIHKNLDITKSLVEAGANVNAIYFPTSSYHPKHDWTALSFAVDNGSLKIVQLLIGHGAKVDKPSIFQNEAPIHITAKRGYSKILRLLLKHKANTKAESWFGLTTLHFACLGGVKWFVKQLIQNGSDINDQPFMPEQTRPRSYVEGITPLDEAIRGGHIEIVRFLIKKRAKIKLKDKSERTALHYSAWYNRVNIAKFLIEKGLNVNAKSENNETPIFYAVKEGYLKMVKLLVNNGASINLVGGDFGDTLLHRSVTYGHYELSVYLIKKGSEVNAKDGFDMTSLHWAVERGHTNIAKLLIGKGANVNAKTKDGETPLDLAKSKDMKKLLRQAGAKRGKELK